MHLNPSLISHPVSPISHPASIKNLIFDFGGVICNIDVKLTENAFIDLGLKAFNTKESITDSRGLFDKLETGSISPADFRMELKRFFRNPVTDDQLDQAWNAMLLDIPVSRIRLLEKLRTNYRIFLLSNSNEIHNRKYSADFSIKFGYQDLDSLFEKAWFSFNIGLKKPDSAIFDYVVKHSRIDPYETLFIDDTLVHVEGANKAGLHAHHLNLAKNEEISALFN